MASSSTSGVTPAITEASSIKRYYQTKIEESEVGRRNTWTRHAAYLDVTSCSLQHEVNEKSQNLRRLQAQRNELNSKVRALKEELQQLHEQGSYVGEVAKAMDKKKVLVKVFLLLPLFT